MRTIGYYNRTSGNFITNAFTGASGYVDTGRLDAGYLSGNDTQGRTGNAIIVTPIADPVVRFNEYDMQNLTTESYLFVTFRTPQYAVGNPFRTQLGFVGVSSPQGIRGRVHDKPSGDYVYALSDFLGFYDGDDPNYIGSSLYSTLHFYSTSGTLTLDPGERGIFDFYVAYPGVHGAASFYMDVTPSTSNASDVPNSSGYRFNPDSNPGGGIVLLAGGTSAPEPGTLALGTLGLIGLAVLARRQTR